MCYLLCNHLRYQFPVTERTNNCIAKIPRYHYIRSNFFITISWQEVFFPAKTIFASPVLTAEKPIFPTNWQQLSNPE